ncbi:cell wall hydrolase [Bacillus sp. FJAT-27225]|uniref:N-acetylmuramoyl-L-alanine amidase n=1 Tax=Bacillus sp. FJAT-27225 TaxID=1743144 RepID=UPI00080C2605|nr:N-acetylmuramoyl-L-alanine amidase [Bacillus sp. FJAT-27225]OCA88193.1 cell wall hydrolase [Bacillus sp. FJAT-27225]
MKIMLDAGHGYSTAGKRSPSGMKEFEFNRAVAAYARQELETHHNVTVYFAHSDNHDVPLQERTDKANRLNVGAYISIHANAYQSTWNSANGIDTFVYITKPTEAYELALKVQSHLVAMTGRRNRGVKTADFHVLRETNMTSILCECGFMTNKEEEALLRSDTYRRTVARAIVAGIAEQYHLNKKSATKHAPKPDIGADLYKVQAGAFKDRQNANVLLERLKAKGHESFVIKETHGFFKVQSRTFQNKENADTLVKKLSRDRFDAFVYRD